MVYKYVEYKKKYTSDASLMMNKTWQYDKLFKGLKNNNWFYSLIFWYSFTESDYCDLIVDEHDKLVGFLMAGDTKDKLSFNKIGLSINVICRWLIGQFGNPISALRTATTMYNDATTLMKDKELYDNEIKLFFVDESTRGNGLGKMLMNRYLEYCKAEGINKIILLTDAGCNFGFYDHCGFKQINKIHSMMFAKSEFEYNGYAYAYEIKE